MMMDKSKYAKNSRRRKKILHLLKRIMIEKIQKIEDALNNPSNNAVQRQNLDLREKFNNQLCQHFKKDLKIDHFSIEKDKIIKKLISSVTIPKYLPNN
ncbi:hypothetical protein BpHYR1_053782 [Brachionus plicatilis]|uniref:Uncharacterized protein n=1 Tax=Brachionus plicatilis TaxID=10195 RepID=A0A3M7QMK2_BRAPC|nr:hypothetical protein BpHYR1_053782 [Brachionus plicatilis]